MKKALQILLAVMLVVAAASPAMAIDWSAKGGINVLNVYYKNVDLRLPIYLGGPPGMNDKGLGVGAADPAWNRDSWFMQMRMQLYITARASEDLSGTIGFEIDSIRFGDADAKYIPTNGTSGLGKYTAGRWNADAIAIAVKHMYITFRIPELPVWLTVGIQPYFVRPWVMLCDDGAGISARIALKAGDFRIGINPFWGKIKEGVNESGTPVSSASFTDYTEADDHDLYGIDTNVGYGPVRGGLYFIYQARRQLYDSTDGSTLAGEGDSKQWWVGPYFDLRMGPLNATLDFVYNGGYEVWQGGLIMIVDPANPLNFIPAPQGYSRRHQGMLFRGEASYTMNKFRFGLGGLYGTGDDPTTLDTDEGFNLNYNGEAAPVQSDFLILCGDWGLSVPYGATGSIIGFYKPWSTPGQGVWYVRGFADYAVTDWLKLLVNAGYIGDTVDNGDEFGRDADDDDNIGWELDVAAQVKIYRNLTLSTAFGYLIGGKALSMANGDRPQDPWAWVTTLSYVF